MDKLIQEYLRDKAKEVSRTKDCLSDRELADYIEARLSREKKDRIETHLAKCFFCQNLLITTKEILDKHAVKSRFWKDIIFKNKWLILGLVSFTLSFIVPRYFLQLLLAAFLLGLKWVFSGEGTRNLVMVIRTLRGQEVPSEFTESRKK